MRMPDGTTFPLKVRSLVGLLPLCAATVFDADVIERHPELIERARAFVEHFSDAVPSLAHLPGPGEEGRRLLALVDETQLRQILAVMLDEDEFLGPHGIRSISRRHLDEPCRFDWGGAALRGPLPARRVRHRHVRRQLELARAGLVPDEPRDPARAAAAAPLLRRRLQGRVPDRLGARAGPRARSRRRSPAGSRGRSPRTSTAAGPCSAASRSSRPTRTGTTCCSSTSTSTATTAPASAPATRPGWTGTVALLLLMAAGAAGAARRQTADPVG